MEKEKTGNDSLGSFEVLEFANHTVVIQSDSVLELVNINRVKNEPNPKGNATPNCIPESYEYKGNRCQKQYNQRGWSKGYSNTAFRMTRGARKSGVRPLGGHVETMFQYKRGDRITLHGDDGPVLGPKQTAPDETNKEKYVHQKSIQR